jgi:2'-hydroxyisoflavone reductase
MNVLILGGTRFLGRAITEAALDAGHTVTLFNRGQTNSELFPDVEKLVGDRDGDLEPLEGRRWDAVIDTCGYVPRIVHKSAALLADSVEHYTFISSISVYDQSILSKDGTTEDGPLATIDDETTEEITGETYGALKVLCEQVAEDTIPGRVLNVRSGLIVGPHDPTDRFTYWPVWTARGGDLLAPPADAPIQVIDVRDLAAWLVQMVAARKTGIYNVTGPDTPLDYGQVMKACAAAAGMDAATIIHADEDFLVEHEVREWVDLPLWLPASHNGMVKIDISKALADGLHFRSIEETVRDTLAWFKNERGLESELKAGINAEREQELLAAWRTARS